MADSYDSSNQPNPKASDRNAEANCPFCGGHLVLDKIEAGSAIPCPGCGQQVQVSEDVETIESCESGVTLGKFKLVEVIGQGAFGVVWKARDTELERWVAVKVPRRGSIDPVEIEPQHN